MVIWYALISLVDADGGAWQVVGSRLALRCVL
jgi:hypothetical protein